MGYIYDERVVRKGGGPNNACENVGRREGGRQVHIYMYQGRGETLPVFPGERLTIHKIGGRGMRLKQHTYTRHLSLGTNMGRGEGVYHAFPVGIDFIPSFLRSRCRWKTVLYSSAERGLDVRLDWGTAVG